MIKSLALFLKIHKEAKDKLRLGQRFCNMFIKEPMPELYYEENDDRAERIIYTYLFNLCYINELPQRVDI